MPILLTKQQTAQLLQISVATVDRLLAAGRLERLAGLRHVRVTAPSLARYAGLPVADVLAAIGAPVTPSHLTEEVAK